MWRILRTTGRLAKPAGVAALRCNRKRHQQRRTPLRFVRARDGSTSLLTTASLGPLVAGSSNLACGKRKRKSVDK